MDFSRRVEYPVISQAKCWSSEFSSRSTSVSDENVPMGLGEPNPRKNENSSKVLVDKTKGKSRSSKQIHSHCLKNDKFCVLEDVTSSMINSLDILDIKGKQKLVQYPSLFCKVLSDGYFPPMYHCIGGDIQYVLGDYGIIKMEIKIPENEPPIFAIFHKSCVFCIEEPLDGNVPLAEQVKIYGCKKVKCFVVMLRTFDEYIHNLNSRTWQCLNEDCRNIVTGLNLLYEAHAVWRGFMRHPPIKRCGHSRKVPACYDGDPMKKCCPRPQLSQLFEELEGSNSAVVGREKKMPSLNDLEDKVSDIVGMINPHLYEDSEMSFEEHSKPVKSFATELADILNRNYVESANVKFKECQLPETFYKIENNSTKEQFEGDMLHNTTEPYFGPFIGNECLELENHNTRQVEDVCVTSDVLVSACSSTISTDHSKALGCREISSELGKPSETFNFERVSSSTATKVPYDKVKSIDEIDTKINGETQETLGMNCVRTKNKIVGVEPKQELEFLKPELCVELKCNSPLKFEKHGDAFTNAIKDSELCVESKCNSPLKFEKHGDAFTNAIKDSELCVESKCNSPLTFEKHGDAFTNAIKDTELFVESKRNSPLKFEKHGDAITNAIKDSLHRSTDVFPDTLDKMMVNSNAKPREEKNLSNHSSCDELNVIEESSHPQLFHQNKPLSSTIETTCETSACVSKDILKRDLAEVPELSVEKSNEMSELSVKWVGPLISGHNSTDVMEKSKIIENNCLYNQSGKLCRVSDERYIISTISQRQELVSLGVSHTRYVHVRGGFKVVWRGSTAVPVDEIEDGSEVTYDAILSPDKKSFVAVILWIHKKPQLIPLSPEHTYLYISSCSVPCTNFSVTSGISHAEAVYDSKEIDVCISGDIFHLSKNCPSNGNTRVNKVIQGGGKGSLQYYCNCIWVDSSPPKDEQKLQKLEVYKKLSSGALTQETEYSYLLVDIPGVLKKVNNCYEFICELRDYSYHAKISLEELPGMNLEGQTTAMGHIEYCKELNIFTIMLIHFPEQNKTFDLVKYCTVMETASCESSVEFQNQGALDLASISQVNNYAESHISQESKGRVKNEVYDGVSGTYHSRTKDYLFLNIKGNSKHLQKGIAAVHLSNSYIENKSLSEYVVQSVDVPLNHSIWYCRLETINTIIDGIQVEYIAKLAWQGKKPVPINTISKKEVEANNCKSSVKFEDQGEPVPTKTQDQGEPVPTKTQDQGEPVATKTQDQGEPVPTKTQVTNYTRSPSGPESGGDAENKIYDNVSCTYYTMTNEYVFLNIKSKSKDLQNSIAALHLSNGYVEDKSLSEHFAHSGVVPLDHSLWYCRLEAINTVLDGIQVEYVARLAWQGRKPVPIDTNSEKDIKVINHESSAKFENQGGPDSAGTSQVEIYNRSPIDQKSHGYVKNKVFEAVTGTYFKRTKHYVFLNITGRSKNLQTGIAALHLSNAYIENKSLSEHVAQSGNVPLKHSIWYCKLEAIDAIIDGIQVEYIAKLAWQGKKPVPVDTNSKKEIKAINHESIVKFENRGVPDPTRRSRVKIFTRSRVDQESEGDAKKKVFDAVTCMYYARTKHYVFLKITGKSKNLQKGIAALHLSNGYIENKSLSEHVAQSRDVPLNHSVWYCKLETINTIIDGIQVEYVAKLAWQGKKPSTENHLQEY
ncbi:uncharacterized protein [Palaemon carinicauda]|uniref:uncharacterized protein isoform X2 n=1 Tax=Palaemon carinicauda TaxID=392227 RepID=UPI0035B67E4A